MKQAIVVRRDLGLSPGKLAAQVAHAAVAAADSADDRVRQSWRDSGQKKIVLGVDTASELQDRHIEANRRGLATALITDAGHTELEPGTTTALGVGPAEDHEVDAVTGDLSLY